MKVIKRDGRHKEFDYSKIYCAIEKAYKDTYGEYLDCYYPQIDDINDEIFSVIEAMEDEYIGIEEIQDIVVDVLGRFNRKVAESYSDYRYRRDKAREINGELFKSIEGIINGSNKKVLNENGNKIGTLNSVQRDLIAGEVSRAMAKKMIPSDTYAKHEEGSIHIHDLDYFIHNSYNCELVNLKDMLDKGTVINGKLIESPNSLRTAMNVATQISAVVSSNTYGGQTMSISHFSPYLRKSINTIRNKYEGIKCAFNDYNETQLEDIIQKEIKKEIVDSVQTLAYQLNTLSSTNGQTPFFSLALYLNEYPEYIKETAMLIEEIFNQRILGIKNENGVAETPPFPKLLYFLDENNTYEGSEYFYLTELASVCCSKRMNPDFISVKIMKERIGMVFPCIN